MRVLRQVGAGSDFSLREEGRGVLLHQAVQRGLLGTGSPGVALFLASPYARWVTGQTRAVDGGQLLTG